MKLTRLLLFAIFASFILSSCSSSDNEDYHENDLSLVGIWELKNATDFSFEMKTNNALFDTIVKDWSKDNPVYSYAILEFKKDGTFSYSFKVNNDEKDYYYPGSYLYSGNLLSGEMIDENGLSTRVSTKIEVIEDKITISNQSWLYNFSNKLIKDMLLHYAEDLKHIDLTTLKIENISFSMTLTKSQ